LPRGVIVLLFPWLHLRDTYWALMLSDTTFALPLTVWVLTSFFRDIPDDLLRAARVDGCTRRSPAVMSAYQW